MALSMLDKKAEHTEKAEWPAEIKAEFERESRQPNGCVGTDAAVGDRQASASGSSACSRASASASIATCSITSGPR